MFQQKLTTRAKNNSFLSQKFCQMTVMTQLTISAILLIFECEFYGCSPFKSPNESCTWRLEGLVDLYLQYDIVFLLPSFIANTYSVFLNSSSVCTVYDINERKGFW